MYLRLSLAFGLGLSAVGCSSSSSEAPAPSPPSSAKSKQTSTETSCAKTSKSLDLVAAKVTYEDLKDMVETSCATCHGQGGQRPILTTFDQVKEVDEKFALVVADLSMPPRASLEKADVDRVAKWAEGGFLKDPSDKGAPKKVKAAKGDDTSSDSDLCQ